MLGHDFNHSIDSLPDSIELLHLSDQFQQPIHRFPESLQYLDLGHDFNLPLPPLPSGLRGLCLSNMYNLPLGDCLNACVDLDYVEAGLAFNQVYIYFIVAANLFYLAGRWSITSESKRAIAGLEQVESIG